MSRNQFGCLPKPASYDHSSGYMTLISGHIKLLYFASVINKCLLTDVLLFSGNKKQIRNVLKNLIGLYSSCSSEVVYVLLNYLLKALNSSNSMEPSEDTQVGCNIDTSLNEWKLVITKFSNKEPELPVALLNAVLDMIEIQEAMEYETGIYKLYLGVTVLFVPSVGHGDIFLIILICC